MKLGSALVAVSTASLLLSGCTPAQTVAPEPSVKPPATTAPAATVPPPAPSASPSATPPPPSPTPTPTETQPPEIAIDSVWNFRDVAGKSAGLPLSGDGHMKRGVVYRSGKLKGMSQADRRTLVEAGLTDIFDLRTDEVAKRTPDPAIGDATYHLVNVYGVYSYSDPVATSAEQAMKQREELNRDFVSDARQRRRIGGVLKDIAEADGAVIIHCSEGKDRTGWVSALLQLIAGVDKATIMDEYLLSNELRAELIDADVAKVRKSKGKTEAEIRLARLTVHERYLLAGMDELRSRYGNLDGYLTDGLGLSETTIEALRDKLVLQ